MRRKTKRKQRSNCILQQNLGVITSRQDVPKHSKKGKVTVLAAVSKDHLCCADSFYICPNQYNPYFIQSVHLMALDLLLWLFCHSLAQLFIMKE